MVKTKNSPKKSLGQNFFKNKKKAADIVDMLDINKNDVVVEIGGGKGLFSEILANHKPKQLFIYELDDDLIPTLQYQVSHHLEETRIEILNENVLDADFSEYRDYKVFGAIPYNITSPIIHKLLSLKNRPKKIVLIIQNEVAEKITSEPPKGSYWSHITLGYNVKKGEKLKANNFNPAPRVDSRIIELEINEKDGKLLTEIGFRNWEKFLHHVFRQPRKMIKKSVDPKHLLAVGIDPNCRAQNVSTSNLIKLFNEI